MRGRGKRSEEGGGSNKRPVSQRPESHGCSARRVAASPHCELATSLVLRFLCLSSSLCPTSLLCQLPTAQRSPLVGWEFPLSSRAPVALLRSAAASQPNSSSE